MKILKRLNLKKFFLIATTFFSLLLILYIYERFIFSFNFTDEGDNISIGKFLLQGKKLYKDVFSQHQPLTYYFSSLVQKIANPQNILMVIKRHREVVIAFSFCWIILLVWRFGFLFILPSLIFELIKYYFLGHLFLAESFVGYPLVFLFFLAWELLSGKKISLFDNFIASLSIFWISFNLLPTAPLAIFFYLFFIWKQRKELKKNIFLTIPFLISILTLVLIIPIYYYYEGSILGNLVYYIPESNKIAFKVDEPLWWQLFKIPFYPLLAFNNLNNSFFRILGLLFIIFVFGLFVYFKKSKKDRNKIIFLLFVLFVANLRSPVGSGVFYHAFHSLPYLCLFVFSTFLVVKTVFFELKLVAKIKNWFYLLIVLIFALLVFDKQLFFWLKFSKENMQYVQFSRLFDSSTAIRIMGDPDDTLAVMPYEELIYWLPDVQPATRFLFYHSWVYDVPKFKSEIDTSFKNNPPTFVFWENTCLAPYLETTDYINLPRDSTVSGVFIHKTKLPKITEKEWQELEYYRYNRIK